ncbi:uncharacterized protein V6R79_012856 [Siganus canaliculatus]
MSVKLPRKLSSKKKKPLKNNAQTELLNKLGLEAFLSAPLDPASMLDISTWTLDSQTPSELKDLPNAFLKRLWLLSPDARSPCCKPSHEALDNGDNSTEEMTNGFGDSQCPINPLDLVTAVFMAADPFLQQEVTVRMMRCQFSVPWVLPNVDPEEPSRFLLWPLRGVVGQWPSQSLDANRKFVEGNLASTPMPVVSVVKLGHCSISKSRIVNNVIGSSNETFLHRGLNGGELPRRLSNGLVEIGWYLRSGDPASDAFPVPMVISNLRGDASSHEKLLGFLCQASSAVVIFSGNLREKDKQVLTSCKDTASKLIVIDVSDTEKSEKRVGFVDQDLEDTGPSSRSVLPEGTLSEGELVAKLHDTLKDLWSDQLKLVTLETAARLAEELGLHVDEGAVCKKTMTMAEEVLKGLEEGSVQFIKKELPLQGVLWRKLAEIEKEERRQRKEEKEIDTQLQKEKQNILVVLSSYKMTRAMKIFTDGLFTSDKVERTYFINWLKVKLQLIEIEKHNGPEDLRTSLQAEKTDDVSENCSNLGNGADDDPGDSDSFCSDSTFEEDQSEQQPTNTEMQVSELQFEDGPEVDQKSTEKPKDLQLLDKECPEPTCNLVIEQGMMSNEKHTNEEEITDNTEEEMTENTEEEMTENTEEEMTKNNEEEMTENTEEEMTKNNEEEMTENTEEEMSENKVCLEEQISHPGFDGESCHLKSGKTEPSCYQEKHQNEPELILEKLETTPCAQQPACQDASSEHQVTSETSKPHQSSLGLEHFLREMGLIFELTHISPASGSQNVLRLPSLAADLLLYGIPLELMDGDASSIPSLWLGCVFAELKRRLPPEQSRIRVLTSLGQHHARNAEVLSALFGVNFPEGRRRTTKGLYMVALCLPDDLKQDMECDFLLLIDVEGLCSDSKRNTSIHDNELATVATGLSDVLMHNISCNSSVEFETSFPVAVNALLRIKECGSMPICQLLVHDEGVNSMLQASQLQRVSDMLQTETGDRQTNSADPSTKTTSSITHVKVPWCNLSQSEPIDAQYSETVLKMKQTLFGALKESAAKSGAAGLPEFMNRLATVWDTVKTDSLSISLQNVDSALAFSLLCTEFSQWGNSFQEHMENWITGATRTIFATKAKTLDAMIQNGLLKELKDEASEEIQTEVDKLRSKVETSMMKDEFLKMNTFKPVLMCNINDLQGQVTHDVMQRLESVSESHSCSSQLKNFEALLEKEEDSRLHVLIENSRSTKVLLQDEELEEEFESIWNKVLSNFDFRPSETDDITARVTNMLKENLTTRGLQKHMKKMEITGQKQTSDFFVYDEHFGYRSRLKHMFEDNNRLQRLEAQQLACDIIEKSNEFVADKSSSPADFSDSYITELLEQVDKALTEKTMEIRSAFEVDLKVYICNSACEDFQKLHDRYAKDRELLTSISANKNSYFGVFVYQFRKRDQCQRVAQAFTSLVVKPTVLKYIYNPLGTRIVEEIQSKAPQFKSQRAFQQSLLEELIHEDSFESFLEYLHSCDTFRLKRVQAAVVAHLSESTNLNKWRQQRLGEIIGKFAAAVSETVEGTSGVLSDAKLLLVRVCLTLEKDGDVDVVKASLDGPLFSITTEWDRFVTCLLELLAAVRLDLTQEFSQSVDITHFLQCLPVQPHHIIFNRVTGCDRRCPVCKAPCELEEMGHDVHRALMHRPKGLLPQTICSASCVSRTEGTAEGEQSQDRDADEMPADCEVLQSLYPDWTISPEDQHDAYWRYVLARFNERFAEEYNQEPERICEQWRRITEEEALCSVREAFSGQR